MAQADDILRRVQDTLGQLQSLIGQATKADQKPRAKLMPLAPDSSLQSKDVTPAKRLKVAQSMLSVAAARDKAFGLGYFFDPAWHMLIELYISWCFDGEMSTSALCIASRSPQTTGLRWIAVLEKDGLIIKRSDPFDKRRTFIELSDEGVNRVEKTIDKIIESQTLLDYKTTWY